MAQTYIIIAIITLAIIIGLLILTKKTRSESMLSPLAGLSFVLIITGVIFGENQIIGYSLMGAGVLIALIDIVKKLK
jgi:hypothetical protein